ncbi:SIS domain-containing protein [Sphingomonas sp. BK580]|uniref:SIS domain-containing protein n=1 Tax=Sphingomonas sp. BK580 TaxID=2586972 RepID=UPI00160C7851|nr:aminotransferase [Sphingomonas sp. BK580]MBB3695656.1 fructoselysine-6-P-deglycase FrlB-like protein [Sphingomonas sp. BK580]
MSDHPGLAAMLAEMRRQRADALATLDAPCPAADAIVESVRRTGALLLYAMGGSQHVNRIAAPLYRDLGLDARTMIASAALSAPPPDRPRTALILSQSGESGEIRQLLARPAGSEERYGLTLEPGSTLARSARAAVVAHGGTEHAFAATRSIVLSLAMHGAVLERLGSPQSALRQILGTDAVTDMTAAAETLYGCDAFVFAGWHAMHGTAESAALSLMELARLPSIGFEGGQFRHGPFELLRPGIGVTLLRSAGADAALVPPTAAAVARTGAALVVLDASGSAPLAEGTQVTLAANDGLAAATDMVLALQQLNIAMALKSIPAGIGTPRHTSKVTE